MIDFFNAGRRADCRKMVWTQPRPLRREFHLVAHGDVVGKLAWRSLLGSLARAESPAGAWHFEKDGFIGDQAFIYLASSGRAVARFKLYRRGGGLLTLAGIGEYH